MASQRSPHPDQPEFAMLAGVHELAGALARNDRNALEAGYGHRHNRFVRVLFQAAALEPMCCPTSAVPVALSIVLSLLISGGWQVAAVYLASKYELGLGSTVPVLIAGTVIALLVVSFDWDIIHKRVRGETHRPMLFVRFAFVLVMAILVSEAIAGMVFNRDIATQISIENNTRRHQREERVTADYGRLQALSVRLEPLTRAVTEARSDLAIAQAEMTRQDRGLLDASEGRGQLWETARLQRDKASADLARAQEALKLQGDPIRAEEAKIQEAQDEFFQSIPIIDPKKLGPGERERALWTYLVDHPDALWLRRVPLALVLVVLDLFAVLIGWSVSASLPERHRQWSAEVSRLDDRARRLRIAILDRAEDDLHRHLDAEDQYPAAQTVRREPDGATVIAPSQQPPGRFDPAEAIAHSRSEDDDVFPSSPDTPFRSVDITETTMREPFRRESLPD